MATKHTSDRRDTPRKQPKTHWSTSQITEFVGKPTGNGVDDDRSHVDGAQDARNFNKPAPFTRKRR